MQTWSELIFICSCLIDSICTVCTGEIVILFVRDCHSRSTDWLIVLQFRQRQLKSVERFWFDSPSNIIAHFVTTSSDVRADCRIEFRFLFDIHWSPIDRMRWKRKRFEEKGSHSWRLLHVERATDVAYEFYEFLPMAHHVPDAVDVEANRINLLTIFFSNVGLWHVPECVCVCCACLTIDLVAVCVCVFIGFAGSLVFFGRGKFRCSQTTTCGRASLTIFIDWNHILSNFRYRRLSYTQADPKLPETMRTDGVTFLYFLWRLSRSHRLNQYVPFGV